MKIEQVKELLLQSLEHERGGVKVYETAIQCAIREDLRQEWSNYLAQTRQHVDALARICELFELDPFTTTPGTQIVKATGTALLNAMQQALATGKPAEAQVVAAECVVLAETKDHLDWELLGEVAANLQGEQQQALRAAYQKIEDEEDEHLYHTHRAGRGSYGWNRSAWRPSCRHPRKSRMLPRPPRRRPRNSSARRGTNGRAQESRQAQKGFAYV